MIEGPTVMYSSQHQSQPPMDNMVGNGLDQGISGTINPAALSQSGTFVRASLKELSSCVAASVRLCQRLQGTRLDIYPEQTSKLTERLLCRSLAHPDLPHQ